jgi:hypothetical protein
MNRLDDLNARINQGSRPSRLDVGRLVAGELEGDEQEAMREAVRNDPAAQAYATEVEEARASVRPFDAEGLNKLALRLAEDDEAQARRQAAATPVTLPWWRRILQARWFPVMAAVAAAAIVLVAVLPQIPGIGPQPGEIRTKGKPDIDFYLLRDGEVFPGDASALHHPGDRLQFTYRSDGEGSLVLLSVDGTGHVTVFYPSKGEVPVAIIPGERHVLPGSIELDDAPDFELFLAFFGSSDVEGPVRDTESVFANGGSEALLRMAEDSPDIAAIFLHKAPAEGGGR